MKIISTKFSGLKVIESKLFKDNRGFFKEDFKKILQKRVKNLCLGCTSSSKKRFEGCIYKPDLLKANMFQFLKRKILDVVID